MLNETPFRMDVQYTIPRETGEHCGCATRYAEQGRGRLIKRRHERYCQLVPKSSACRQFTLSQT